jgi:ABC-2 type transport system ATP-binding protein
VLLTSHDLADVEQTADRLAILDRGRIVALGSPQELAGGAAARIRFRLATPLSQTDRVDLASRLRDVDGAAGASLADEGAGRYAIEGATPSPAQIAALTAWCGERGTLVVELRSGGASLEERYLELVGGGDASPDTSPETAS